MAGLQATRQGVTDGVQGHGGPVSQAARAMARMGPRSGLGVTAPEREPGVSRAHARSSAEINNGPLTSGGHGEGGRQGGGETGEVAPAVRDKGGPLNQQHQVTPAGGSFHSSSLT